MKKSIITVVFIVLVGVAIVWIGNSSLFGVIDCRCYLDNEIMKSCELYCSRRASYCTYFEIKGSQCFSGMCSQTWIIGCENGLDNKAGANAYCADCIEDNDDDKEPPSHSFFTPW